MSLDKMRVTRASMIALPTHIFVSAGLGLCWLTQASPETSAALMSLDSFWPLTNTAIVLLVLAAAELATWVLLGARNAEGIVLGMGTLTYFGLAGITFAQHLAGSSFGGVVVFTALGLYHLASLVSLVFHDAPGDGSPL